MPSVVATRLPVNIDVTPQATLGIVRELGLREIANREGFGRQLKRAGISFRAGELN